MGVSYGAASDILTNENDYAYSGLADGVTAIADETDTSAPLDTTPALTTDATVSVADVSNDTLLSALTLVGCNAGTPIGVGQVLRLTITEPWYGTVEGFFAKGPDGNPLMYHAAQSFYNNINVASCHCVPLSPFAMGLSDASVVIDVVCHDAVQAVSKITNTLALLCSNPAQLTQVELLSPAAKAVAADPAKGAVARQAAKAAADSTKNNALDEILAKFESLGSIVKWSLVGIIIVVVLYFAYPYLRVAKSVATRGA